jgi:HlyD family secretion protein
MEDIKMQTTAPFPQARTPAGVKRPQRRWMRWLLIPLILAVIAGSGLWWRSSQQTTATTTTTGTVSQGDLTASVSGNGAVAAARTVDIPLQQAGTLTAIDVQVGDTMKAGQILAQIDSAELQLQLQQAQANLAAAQASYAQVKNGSATEQDLASAQAQLASAQAQLAKTKTSGATDIQSAQAQLASAQAKLDALKNPSAADLSAAQNKVDQAQLALQNTRDSSSQSKTNAGIALQNAVNSLTQAQSKYSVAQSNWQHVQDEGTDPINPTTTGSDGTKKANKLNDAQRQQYYDAFVQAQAALGSAQNAVTQAQVASDTARQNEVTSVQQAEAALKAAQADLAALKSPSASDLAQAQAAVTQAKATLTALQGGGTASSLSSAQASVVQAQSNLESLTAPATESELATAEANLLQAQVAVETAQASLAQATLTAPFDGVVSAVNIVADSTISANTSAVTLVDASKLHVDVSLSETDAVKVQVGQHVELSFDALPNATIGGMVTSVAPVATEEQNVVTYAVQVEFDPGTSAVKIGMSATADIQVNQATNALLVPSRAVQTSGGSKTVTVQQPGGATLAVPVETGLTSNGQTEIVKSGADGIPALKAGDVVLIPSSTSTSTSSTRSTTSGLGGLTGGPPTGGPPGP